MTDQLDNGPAYLVVVNDEEQYSLWRSDRELPAGWSADGASASREDCLDRISRQWTDLRPLSLRKRLEMERA